MHDPAGPRPIRRDAIMHASFGDVEAPACVPAVLLVVALSLAMAWPARGQADTTDAAPSDTTEPAADSLRAVPDTAAAPTDTTRLDTTGTTRPGRGPRQQADRQEVPPNPRRFPDPLYGRPPVDSLPAITPHVGFEHLLAQQRHSFFYDLGEVGWPHGWDVRGLGPHRSRLWIEGHPYDSPLTGRARFDLVPPSFLKRPGVGVDPGGSAVGVHASWRDYDQTRPVTELRYRRSSGGLNAIEVGHSQKHRLSLLGSPGIFQITVGYGGREGTGVYSGSDLRRERRLWGRLRYQRDEWAVELSDLSSRHRIGAHSGVVPSAGAPFNTIYVLPSCEDCSVKPSARRNTFRNDLTARFRGPLLPTVDTPTELSATWTSNTFDFKTSGDTTWTTKLNGGHGSVRQSLRVGRHRLTLGVRGSLWGVARTNVAEVGGRRWSAHAFGRDSLRLGGTRLVLDAGWHATSDQQYPSGRVRLDQSVGPLDVRASATVTGQRASWYETDGFSGLVRPLPRSPSTLFGRVVEGQAGLTYTQGPLDLRVDGFAHQIRNALDLYAVEPPSTQRVASTDTAVARRTSAPMRRAGATVSMGWRRDASRGLYLSGRATALSTLNAGASSLHTRLARTLPTVYGRGRIGARFVFFVDLVTDLYVEARGWTSMNSRWFHPPTGRLVVPPATNPIPSREGFVPGPNGTIDIHAELKLRGATLFFALENAHVSFAQPGTVERQATLQQGAFVVPVYPLPARHFRFGVHWPIFD